MRPLLLLPILLTSCATFRSPKLSGGTAEERAMVHGALNTQIPYLRSKGYNVPDRRDRLTLHPQPAVAVQTLRSGAKQGVLRFEAGRPVYAEANGVMIRFARPATPEMFAHEVKHSILSWGGYHHESASHDRRAFPEAGVIR